jgi:uncharacterized membrane protein
VVKTSNRLTYLDWLRGLAALIMLQGHVIDAWVQPQDRSSEWFWLSQFLGGLPAPMFLFLVGVSLALMLGRMRENGATSRDLTIKIVRRGLWILFLAYVFRVEQFLIWYPASRWSDIFKIDTLNCIAACTLVAGLLSVVFKSRRQNIVVMAAAAAAFVIVTPWVYPMQGLPDFFMAYLNGNGQPSSFSLFPWASFAFTGISFGYVLLEAKERIGERLFFQRVAAAGIIIYAAGVGMSLSPIFQYGFFDYSLTSPHFFLVRLGWILLILYGAFLWSRRKTRERWSPVIALGQASLIVYWLHIEVVYGRLGFGPTLPLSKAAAHLLWLVPLMLLAASHRSIRQKAAEVVSRLLPRNSETMENAG